jgi:hypothetical protein
LVFSIGINTLAWASQHQNGGPLKGKILDAEEFAKEIAIESENTFSDSVGDTPLTKLLDDLFIKVAEKGTISLDYI